MSLICARYGCLLCLYCQLSMVAKGHCSDYHVGMWIQVKGNHFVQVTPMFGQEQTLQRPLYIIWICFFYFLFQELIEELQIYFLFFDRAGYGESDPNPKRSVKSEAFDIQELADKLHIGSRFYVIGLSIGTNAVWSCLKYIPHRHDNFPSFSVLTAWFLSYTHM